MKSTLRGTCPVCLRRRRVTREGFIYEHTGKGGDYFCFGGWKRPIEAQEAFTALEELQRARRRELAQELCS